MTTLTRSRNRRGFQPSFDTLALRIAPTLFLPSPGDQPVAEVSFPDCDESGGAPDTGPSRTINRVQVAFPDCVE